jgi:hypothetical protein
MFAQIGRPVRIISNNLTHTTQLAASIIFFRALLLLVVAHIPSFA